MPCYTSHGTCLGSPASPLCRDRSVALRSRWVDDVRYIIPEMFTAFLSYKYIYLLTWLDLLYFDFDLLDLMHWQSIGVCRLAALIWQFFSYSYFSQECQPLVTWDQVSHSLLQYCPDIFSLGVLFHSHLGLQQDIRKSSTIHLNNMSKVS